MIDRCNNVEPTPTQILSSEYYTETIDACIKASSKWEYVKYHQWFIISLRSTAGREVNTQPNDSFNVCADKKSSAESHKKL